MTGFIGQLYSHYYTSQSTIWHTIYSLLHLPPQKTPSILFQSKSELPYDWRFTANQVVLASSPLRPTTKDVFFFNWALEVILVILMQHPFWQDGSVSYEYAWPFVKCTYRTYSMLLKILPAVLYTSPVSTGFAKQIMPILRILFYNSSLAT
jgi:hypothetical protein